MKCIFVKYLHNILCIFIGFCLIIVNYLVMQYFTDPLSQSSCISHKVIHKKYVWTNKNHKDGCSSTLSVSNKYFFINVNTCLVITIHFRFMLFSFSIYSRSTIIKKGYSNADSFSWPLCPSKKW
jgi:hypothetical protein